MLKGQFYVRLILILFVSIFYVKAYMYMAKRNSKEIAQERHSVLKILGYFFASVGVLAVFYSIWLIPQIPFPEEMIGQYGYPDDALAWGYPTKEQNKVIDMIYGIFVFFSISAYCLLFKSSHSKWHSKVFKVLLCILFYAIYVNATNFHTFGLIEWIAIVLFYIMVKFVFKDKDKNKNVIQVSAEDFPQALSSNEEQKSTVTAEDNIENTQCSSNNDKDDTKVESQSSENVDIEIKDGTVNKEESHKEESIINEILTPSSEQSCNANEHLFMSYCPHCGKKIDYERGSFCKYCGKKFS